MRGGTYRNFGTKSSILCRNSSHNSFGNYLAKTFREARRRCERMEDKYKAMRAKLGAAMEKKAVSAAAKALYILENGHGNLIFMYNMLFFALVFVSYFS